MLYYKRADPGHELGDLRALSADELVQRAASDVLWRRRCLTSAAQRGVEQLPHLVHGLRGGGGGTTGLVVVVVAVVVFLALVGYLRGRHLQVMWWRSTSSRGNHKLVTL